MRLPSLSEASIEPRTDRRELLRERPTDGTADAGEREAGQLAAQGQDAGSQVGRNIDQEVRYAD